MEFCVRLLGRNLKERQRHMSKLIREDNAQTPAATSGGAPLSNAAVISHLKACQHIAAEYSTDAFAAFMDALDHYFEDLIDRARSNADATEYTDVRRVFREARSELERYYCGYLSEGFVKFKKRQLNTRVNTGGTEAVDDESLSLVANDELEESIAITSLAQRAESYFAEPLWALNQRYAVLNGGESVSEASNPSSPIQMCESLRKALRVLTLKPEFKICAYKVFDTRLIEMTRAIVEGTNQYLQRQGILPNLRYSLPKGAVPASLLADEGMTDAEPLPQQDIPSPPEAGFAKDPSLSPEEYQIELLGAIRQLQDQLQLTQKAREAVIHVEQPNLVNALHHMQHQAASIKVVEGSGDVVPADVKGVLQQITSVLEEEGKDTQVSQNGLQTIDLVGMVFEYMLDDENLPDRVKALLSYLHTPFLKIAFIDPDFFEKSDHPARLLLNILAEAGSRWVGNDGTQQFDIYTKIKDIVNKVLKDFDNDVKVITTLLLDFKSHTKNILRRQELLEKRATEKAQGEEKLREVKMRVNDEIRGRTHKTELPSAVLLFLLQPWTDYLSFALLRYGDGSDKWSKAVGVVDDLLWAIHPKSSEHEKKKQLVLMESIVTRINAGFETIGFDREKGKKLVDAISSLIKLAYQSKKAEPAPGEMREKLEKIAAEKAGSHPQEDAEMTQEEQQMVEKLKVMEFGTWIELEGGKRLKIAWYNARTSHYMLVDQTGKRVDMMSGKQMAKQMIAKKLKIISGSSKPFFERALENIFERLNMQAEAGKS